MSSRRKDVSLNEAMKHLNVSPIPIGGKPGNPDKNPNGKKPISPSIEKPKALTKTQRAVLERLAAFEVQNDAAQLMKMKKHVWTGKLALEASRSKHPFLNIRIAGTVIERKEGEGDGHGFVVKADVDGSIWSFRSRWFRTKGEFLTEGAQPYWYQQVTKLNGERTPFMLAPGQESVASYGYNYLKVGVESGLFYAHAAGTRVDFMPMLAGELEVDQYDNTKVLYTIGEVLPDGTTRQQFRQSHIVTRKCSGVATLVSRITDEV